MGREIAGRGDCRDLLRNLTPVRGKSLGDGHLFLGPNLHDEGLAVLGEHPDAPGRAWHLPNDPDTRTTRQLVDIAYQHAGRSRSKLRALPPLVVLILLYSGLPFAGVRLSPFIEQYTGISNEMVRAASDLKEKLAERERAGHPAVELVVDLRADIGVGPNWSEAAPEGH